MSVHRIFCRAWVALALATLVMCSAQESRAADEVDQAFAAGNQAAAAGRWQGAARHYERARKLSPGSSATLSYNLGTAYAHLGKLGFATAHLHHALKEGIEAPLAESARQNLGLLRRQAETQAAASGRVLSEPAHWSALLIAFLSTVAVGCFSILLWWIAAALAVFKQRSAAASGRGWSLVAWVGALACFLSLLYYFAQRERQNAEFVVVGATLAVHDGPGSHRPTLFEIQPSSRVRVLQRSSGWAQVRLPGARQGWMLSRSLVPLDSSSASIPSGL